MRHTIFLSAIILLFSACKKDSPKQEHQTAVTVQGAVFNEVNPTDGLRYWKPGVIFSTGVDATGTATISWYIGGSPGNPYYSYSKQISFTITKYNTGYFEFAPERASTGQVPDSVKITAFHLTSGNIIATLTN